MSIKEIMAKSEPEDSVLDNFTLIYPTLLCHLVEINRKVLNVAADQELFELPKDVNQELLELK